MSTSHLRNLFGLALALSLAACSGRSEVEAQLGGNGDSPICKLFTPQEIGSALGNTVEKGHVSGPLGSACSWPIAGQDRSVMIQVVPRDYWEDGTNQPGGEPLEGIGELAFVGPWLDDQRAGALTLNGALYVMTPSKQASVALLRDLVARARESLPQETTEAGQ